VRPAPCGAPGRFVYQCDKRPKGLDISAVVGHTKSMNKQLLSSLPDAQLEALWCDCQVSADYDLQDAVLAVLLQRSDFCPQSYDLLWELQDQGWNGGCSQEDRDAR
jgi:hypothetical protein